jgi:hypothetical protein
MKKEICWIFALGLMIYLSLLQLVMSSTFSLDTVVNTGKQKYSVHLIRSFSGDADCPIVLPIEDISVSGHVRYYLKNDSLKINQIELKREGDKLTGVIPVQSPSTMMVYQIFLEKDKMPLQVNDNKPVLLHFKGKVPVIITFFYGLMVILVILLSNLTGFYAILRVKSHQWLIFLTTIAALFLSFFVIPLYQKYSLNILWLNDWNFHSKMFLISITWLMALILTVFRHLRIWSVLAGLISIAILFIPHHAPGIEPMKMSIQVLERNFIALLQLF